MALKGGEFLIKDATPAEVFIPEDFNEEQRMMADAATEFIEKEVVPQRERFEKCAAFALSAEDGQLVFVDLTGDASCKEHRYPCELAHISALSRSTDEDGKPTVHGTVRWYGRLFDTKGFPRTKKAKFAKYEMNGTWVMEHNMDLTHSMLPMKLPCALYPEKPPELVAAQAASAARDPVVQKRGANMVSRCGQETRFFYTCFFRGAKDETGGRGQ